MKTIQELAAALPRDVATFDGSQYPLPLCQAVLGRLPRAGEVAARLAAADPEVFMGGKWKAGWAFLMDGGQSGLAAELEAADFIVQQGGDRPTAAVSWLQMMVRYAMIWGQIPAGEDHEMGHFLEEDLPGVLIVRGARSELESWLALAMMALGCPAIVPPDFPHAEGRRAEIEDDADVVDAIATLPNMRVREQAGERIALPDGCNPANAREPFEAATTLGGDGRSFFLLRPGDVQDGVEVVGEPGQSVGVLIEVGDERLELDVSEYIERTASNLPGYLPGVRTVETEPFTLGLADGVALDAAKLAAVLHDGVKWHFPKLERIHVRLIFDEAELGRLAPEVAEFRRQRADRLAGLHEQDVDRFVACIECQSFSHRHICVVTPDRPPMCGRSLGQVKAAALFGPTWHPYRRRGLPARELREMVAKGRCLDAGRGEYEGINAAAERLTEGVVQRVFLHSLDGFPHTSCGCFHYLAFRIEGRGIGVMHRAFDGAAPNGQTWDSLANKAGGKQADGVTGLAAGYLRSPMFLKADGGLGAVVWATTKVLDEVRDLLPPGRLPATENDATTLKELDAYLRAR
jgi:acetyl-CoA decarbonylase/synthase complex subunit beta